MKTTLDLPDDLLIEAKMAAARRRITLKAIVEKALRGELRPAAESENPDAQQFEVNELGFLDIKARPDAPLVTSESIRSIQDEIDGDDAQRARSPRTS